MNEEYYKIPEKPQYVIDRIRKIQNSDPVNAEKIVNPVILQILESIAAVREMGGGIAKEIPFAIKPAGWHEGEGTYRFYADIPDEDVTGEHRPDVILDEESADIATYYQVCAAARSFTGYVRLRAKTRPEQEISGVLYLLGKGGGGSGGGGYILPAATPDRLGGVKIGKGISAEPDGTTSVDTDGIAEDLTEPVTKKVLEEATASDEAVDKMLDEVFGEDAEG